MDHCNWHAVKGARVSGQEQALGERDLLDPFQTPTVENLSAKPRMAVVRHHDVS